MQISPATAAALPVRGLPSAPTRPVEASSGSPSEPAPRDAVSTSTMAHQAGPPPDSHALAGLGLAVTAATAQAATPGLAPHGLRIILGGPPGAGKTTHGERLARVFGVPHISMGDLLRREVSQQTALGQQIDDLLQHGDLVPAPVAEACMRRRLEEPDAQRGFILDGFPRRTDDAQTLNDFCSEKGIPPVAMVLIEVSEDEVLKRVENRRVCPQGHTVDIEVTPPHEPGRCDCCGGELKRRNDDVPATVHHRFDVYHQETQPVLDAYQQRGLLSVVDGNGSIDEVAARVEAAARKANGMPV
jgi:adenylate kinase